MCSTPWRPPATAAVDVFAWGCLLAYLAGGVHPFASHSDQEWILRVQLVEPDLSGVPAGLAEVIRATLARNPLDRPSAQELATTCRARGDGYPRPVPRPRREATAPQPHPDPGRRGARDDGSADTRRRWWPWS